MRIVQSRLGRIALPTCHLRPTTYGTWNGHSFRTRARAM